jgi:hypothetical protein
MKLYIAGYYTANFEKNSTAYNKLDGAEKIMHDSAPNRLESYYYINNPKVIERIRANGEKIFLDSGAFSAFTKEAKIEVKDYVAYITRNLDVIERADGTIMASVLDSIGDAYKTYCNQKEMEGMGFTPLPCFHYGEDERYLEYYVANYPFITLGGMAITSGANMMVWLDHIWSKYLTNPDGTAKLKVHGFAITTPSIMRRYPWYSVDSSSWVRIGMTGGIILRRNQKVIAISKTSPSRKSAWQHIDTLPPMVKENALAEIRQYGVDPERLKEIQYARWAFNAGIFSLIEKDCTVDKFSQYEVGFF